MLFFSTSSGEFSLCHTLQHINSKIVSCFYYLCCFFIFNVMVFYIYGWIYELEYKVQLSRETVWVRENVEMWFSVAKCVHQLDTIGRKVGLRRRGSSKHPVDKKKNNLDHSQLSSLSVILQHSWQNSSETSEAEVTEWAVATLRSDVKSA